MNITQASKSGLECFNGCSWQYFLQYICKIRTPSGKAALLGNICHKVLELYARRGLKNSKKIDHPSYLTRLVFISYVKKNPQLVFEESDAKLCIKWVNRVLDSNKDPRRLKVLGIEKGFFLEINLPGFSYSFLDSTTKEIKTGNFAVNGYIDLIHEVDKDTIEIIDYKFGKYTKDFATGKEKELEDFQKDLQIRLYYLAVKRMFPQYKKIIATFNYVQLGKEFPVSFDAKSGDESIIFDVIRRNFLSVMSKKTPTRLVDDKSLKDLHFKCFRVCYFGTTKDDNGRSLCERMHGLYKKHGSVDSVPLIQQLTMSAKDSKKSNLGATEKIFAKAIVC